MTPATNVDLNVPISALGLRPDVKAAEYRIQSAFLDWESVKASVYPSVTIGSTLSAASNKSSSMFNVPFLGGTVNINLPFLQWNKIKWNIKISEADFENARLNLTSSVNTALNEVDTYYYSYEKSVSLLDNLSRRYDNDAKISVYNRMRYEAGATELKDWLDAKTSENSSMLSLLEGKYNTITYENAIYKSCLLYTSGQSGPIPKDIVWKGKLGLAGVGSIWTRFNVTPNSGAIFRIQQAAPKKQGKQKKAIRTR